MFLWFNSKNKCNSNGKVIVIVWEVIVIVIGFLNVSSKVIVMVIGSPYFSSNSNSNRPFEYIT